MSVRDVCYLLLGAIVGLVGRMIVVRYRQSLADAGRRRILFAERVDGAQSLALVLRGSFRLTDIATRCDDIARVRSDLQGLRPTTVDDQVRWERAMNFLVTAESCVNAALGENADVTGALRRLRDAADRFIGQRVGQPPGSQLLREDVFTPDTVRRN